MDSRALFWHAEHPPTSLQRTTLRDLGKDERFLEDRIAEEPGLLGLSSLATGVHGPFHCLQQTPLETPTGRVVYPDLLFVSRSAHLICVEVKLHDNPELMSRAVISQIVDYASAIGALSRGALTEVLRGSNDERSLEDLVRAWFPDCREAGEFASTLLDRCTRGEVELVIACDRAPAGLAEVGRAIDRHAALAFRLRVAEVAPWVAEGDASRLLLLGHEAARTEIVARTLFQFEWGDHGAPPRVTIQTTSLDEIEEATESARAGALRSRDWNADEIGAAIDASEELASDERMVLRTLLAFTVANSEGGRIVSGKTRHPSFNFQIRSAPRTGGRAFRVLWSAYIHDRNVYVYVDSLKAAFPSDRATEQQMRFVRLFGDDARVTASYVCIRRAALGKMLDDFCALSREVRDEAPMK